MDRRLFMGLLAAPFGLAKAAPVAPTRTVYSGRIFPLIGEVPLWRAKQLAATTLKTRTLGWHKLNRVAHFISIDPLKD